jgi:hypothetical protein
VPTKNSDDEFAELWRRYGSARRMAKAEGLDVASIHARRVRMQARGWSLPTVPEAGYEQRVPQQYRTTGWTFPRQLGREIDTGSVVVFSDAHYWPGIITAAHQAVVEVVKAIKPRATIANGDIFDGAKVSRHDAHGWGARPSAKDELHACQERLGEIEQAAPKGCELLWTVGNHDVRFERTLAMHAGEFEGIAGFRLADHFPAWEFAWSFLLNQGGPHPVMVKHRYANGVHAGYNNSMKGGLSILTGHTHALEVKPFCDYRGRRWGIQTGTLLDPECPQTEYAENSPSQMTPGFAVLTFREGVLLPPELCEVIDGAAFFRGQIVA